MLSVCCITYNHEKYISEAIASFLAQKTDFNLEIIIVDDNSTDLTYQKSIDFQRTNDSKIKIYRNQQNLGPILNLTKALNLCSGKYIAWCEGDDYWTDPYKLQKHVDFLEKNPVFSMSFHNAVIKWDDKSEPDKLFCPINQKPTSSIEDVIKGWFIPSASMVFRRDAIMPLPEWYPNIYNGDWALQMIAASKGKIGYLDEPMSVYRKNAGSLSGGIGKDIAFVNERKIQLLTLFDQHTNFQYSNAIAQKKSKLKKDITNFKLYKKSKLLYWIVNPHKFAASVNRVLFIKK
jgi:glycosyltransferase involved in cell wall biosynthesis